MLVSFEGYQQGILEANTIFGKAVCEPFILLVGIKSFLRSLFFKVLNTFVFVALFFLMY